MSRRSLWIWFALVLLGGQAMLRRFYASFSWKHVLAHSVHHAFRWYWVCSFIQAERGLAWHKCLWLVGKSQQRSFLKVHARSGHLAVILSFQSAHNLIRVCCITDAERHLEITTTSVLVLVVYDLEWSLFCLRIDSRRGTFRLYKLAEHSWHMRWVSMRKHCFCKVAISRSVLKVWSALFCSFWWNTTFVFNQIIRMAFSWFAERALHFKSVVTPAFTRLLWRE